jgi:hypothetical protein
VAQTRRKAALVQTKAHRTPFSGGRTFRPTMAQGSGLFAKNESGPAIRRRQSRDRRNRIRRRTTARRAASADMVNTVCCLVLSRARRVGTMTGIQATAPSASGAIQTAHRDFAYAHSTLPLPQAKA